MTLTRKQSKHTARRVTGKSKRTTLDTHQLVERIDAMMREFEIMRRQLTALPKAAVATGLTQELFGAAGKGSRDEYDPNLERVTHLEAFEVGDSDAFAEEVKATRKNKRLMKYLDARTAKSRGQKRIPIAEVRRRLGLK